MSYDQQNKWLQEHTFLDHTEYRDHFKRQFGEPRKPRNISDSEWSHVPKPWSVQYNPDFHHPASIIRRGGVERPTFEQGWRKYGVEFVRQLEQEESILRHKGNGLSQADSDRFSESDTRREDAITIAERNGKKWNELTDAERSTYHNKVPDYVRGKEASRAFYYNVYLRNLLVASGLSPKEAIKTGWAQTTWYG